MITSRLRFGLAVMLCHRYLTLAWNQLSCGILRKVRVSPAVVHTLARYGILLVLSPKVVGARVFLSPGPEHMPCQAGPSRASQAHIFDISRIYTRASVRAACTREGQPGCRLKLLLPTVGHF